jgi:hypothetical protein
MGCTSSKLEPADKEATKHTATIDRMIRMDKKVYDRTIKILLLGRWSKLLSPRSRVMVASNAERPI